MHEKYPLRGWGLKIHHGCFGNLRQLTQVLRLEMEGKSHFGRAFSLCFRCLCWECSSTPQKQSIAIFLLKFCNPFADSNLVHIGWKRYCWTLSSTIWNWEKLECDLKMGKTVSRNLISSSWLCLSCSTTVHKQTIPSWSSKGELSAGPNEPIKMERRAFCDRLSYWLGFGFLWRL